MKVEPAARLDGHLAVPGDKSISHRALLIGAICEGETHISHWGRSGDTESTLSAVRALGVQVDEEDVETLVVHGTGLRGLRAPDAPLDCGNAGTLARLISGILAFQNGRFELRGDESLSRRPMGRIAEPLGLMGAAIETTDGGLPLVIEGQPLTGIDYTLPVASAQVKSAILLAGLGATGRTTVHEPEPTRDHTELMLAAAGAQVTRRPGSATVEPAASLRLPEVLVPATSPPPRRFSSPPPSFPARPSPSTTSASTRSAPGSWTCSSGWAPASASSTGARSPGRRSGTSRSAMPSSSRRRSAAPRSRASSTSCR